MRKTTVRFYALLKWSFIFSMFTVITVFFISPDIRKQTNLSFGDIVIAINSSLNPPSLNWRNFSREQIASLSVLGKYLFLEESPPDFPENSDINKKYKILIWLNREKLDNRHIYHFTKHKFDPFEKCTVRNCELIYNRDDAPIADAILIHLQKIKGVHELPNETGPRPDNQRWVFLTDETPISTFLTPRVRIEDFNGKFNWSMTYRYDSDVPVPYGRTIIKKTNFDYIIESDTDSNNIFKKRNDVLVAVMGSNCGSRNHRWEYVRELQKYIKVDFYGHCGTLKCPGHYAQDCPAIGNYKFYLSFENSNCAQYITEKVWWNAYEKNSIPIVMGARKIDYKQLLPPNSYINVEEFARPVDLARYILYINKTLDVYYSYFEWKKYYQVLNEHGFFQSESYHYCRLCEALNYNNKSKKVYNNLGKYWTRQDCYPGWDQYNNE